MTQSLALHIRACAQQSSTHLRAIKLAQTWLDNGQVLHSVFFSGAAASIAHRYWMSPGGYNTQTMWQSLGCPLLVCVNAALSFGVLSEEEARKHGLPFNLLASQFVIAGLGSLAEAKQAASKFIEFSR